ncbi:MAG: hypothetical protein AB8F94_16700 [Saprospiraceae bacterium]
MDQSEKYALHMCKDDNKKIGHNLDASLLDFPTEAYSEQQVSFNGNLSLTQPLFEDEFFLQSTSHIETLSTLTTTYYLKKKTLWSNNSYYSNSKECNQHFSVNVSVYDTSSENSKNNIALTTMIEHQE